MIFKVRINELRVNGIQMKFGQNSDKQGFFLDGDYSKCESNNNEMNTAFVGIQNERVVMSICKNSVSEDDHVNYNQEIRKNFTVSRLLSLEYKIAKQTWGDVYYKKYDRMQFQQARETCKKDGTSLPVPRSGWFSFDSQRDHEDERFCNLRRVRVDIWDQELKRVLFIMQNVV